MKDYSYFPGCCLSGEGYGKAYEWSMTAVNRLLGLSFNEIPGWNCCGTVPYDTIHDEASFALSARNLSLAEKMEGDMVAPCSSCYVFMSRANEYIKKYPKVRNEVNEALKAGGLEYHGTVRVRKALDIYVNDVGYDLIASKVTKPLTGLKVACYYGCQEVRPSFGFDHPEMPDSMDKLVKALGAEPVYFPLKSRCCGGSLIISEEGASLDLIEKLLANATENGADIMITGCPLCQLNVDAYQPLVNKKFKTNYRMPILFFTQLMGLAYGISAKELGLKTCVINPKKALAGFM